MSKENIHAEGPLQEYQEGDFSFFREEIKHLLETRAAVTDSGKSGLVFRVDASEISPENQEQLRFPPEDDPENALSMKAFKVFNLETAKKEFHILQKARRVMQEGATDPSVPMFRVPRAIRFDEMEVDKAAEELLNKNGAAIFDGKIGVITMDWIEGKNLGVYLYEAALAMAEKNKSIPPESPKTMEDFRALARTLEKSGYVFPQEIFSQLKHGIPVLHEGKVWHNDLYPPNMIVRPDGQLYMIDFGDASEEHDDADGAAGTPLLSDENIVRMLEPLTKTSGDKEKERRESDVQGWNGRMAGIDSKPHTKRQYAMLRDAAEKNDFAVLENQLIGSSSSDQDLENYLAALFVISQEDDVSREHIRSFLDGYPDKKTGTRSFVLNRLKALRAAMAI